MIHPPFSLRILLSVTHCLFLPKIDEWTLGKVKRRGSVEVEKAPVVFWVCVGVGVTMAACSAVCTHDEDRERCA